MEFSGNLFLLSVNSDCENDLVIENTVIGVVMLLLLWCNCWCAVLKVLFLVRWKGVVDVQSRSFVLLSTFDEWWLMLVKIGWIWFYRLLLRCLLLIWGYGNEQEFYNG